MKTNYWNLTNNQINEEIAIAEAATLLMQGETVAFPTETVYGLGADATNTFAVAKIFEAKERPQDNPLIAHVANVEQFKKLVDNLPIYVYKLLENFSPGPLTYVLPSNGMCAENVTAGLSTIAVRIPDHPVALAILEKVNRPIAAPSANLSGKPSPTTAAHVWEDLQGKIAGLVDAGPTGVGVESTVILCRESDVVILRPGGITKEALEEIIPVATIHRENPEKPSSPGMKYKHYAPEVPLWLVSGGIEDVQKVIGEQREKNQRVAFIGSTSFSEQILADENISLGKDLDEVATKLYDALRSLKAEEIDLIIAQAYDSAGIGEAVMNRLRKAATKYIEI